MTNPTRAADIADGMTLRLRDRYNGHVLWHVDDAGNFDRAVRLRLSRTVDFGRHLRPTVVTVTRFYAPDEPLDVVETWQMGRAS